MARFANPVRPFALVLNVALLACVCAGCVVWPEGSGPNAAPMPLAEALARRERGEVVIVDIRSPRAYAEGHIPQAVSMPFDEIASDWTRVRALGRLPVLYCG